MPVAAHTASSTVAPCSTISRLLLARRLASRSARLCSRKFMRFVPTFCGFRKYGSSTNTGITRLPPSNASSSAGLSCSRSPLRNQTTVCMPAKPKEERQRSPRPRPTNTSGRVAAKRRGDAARAHTRATVASCLVLDATRRRGAT